jgi:hypothetical protein
MFNANKALARFGRRMTLRTKRAPADRAVVIKMGPLGRYAVRALSLDEIQERLLDFTSREVVEIVRLSSDRCPGYIVCNHIYFDHPHYTSLDATVRAVS